MPQVPDSQNAIVYTDNRTLIVVAIAPGIQITVSLSDEDIENMYHKRQELAKKPKSKQSLLALPPGIN